MDKENTLSADEKKKGEGKKESIWGKKRKKIFGYGEYLFCGGEEEEKINRRETFVEGKYVFLVEKGKIGEGKGGK